MTARWIATILVAALLATAVSSAQDSQLDSVPIPLQVAVKPLDDDRVEFAVRYLGENVLPAARVLDIPAATHNRWYASTAVTLPGPEFVGTTLLTFGDDEISETEQYRDVDGAWNLPEFGIVQASVKVAVRVLSDGFLEFGVLHQGERILPEVRWLGPSTRTNRLGDWLASSEVEVHEEQTPAALVRDLSHDLTDRANAHVARDCVLEAVTEHETRRGALDAWSSLYSDYRTIGYTESLDKRLSQRQEAVWVYSSGVVGRDGRPADRYVFHVRDVRHQQPNIIWAAEFACSGTADAPASDGRQEVG